MRRLQWPQNPALRFQVVQVARSGDGRLWGAKRSLVAMLRLRQRLAGDNTSDMGASFFAAAFATWIESFSKGGQRKTLRADVVAKKIEAPRDPADEGLVRVLFQA